MPSKVIESGVGRSLLAQLRAPNVIADPPDARVPASTRGLLLWGLVLLIPLVALLRILLPTSTVGQDSDLYLSLANDPFDNPDVLVDNKAVATFALRLLVPLIVWALPFDPDLGFHITSIGGLIAGALVVSVLARRLGLGALALLAGPVYVASFHGVYGLWQWRMVDTVTLALVSGAVLAAYTYRAPLVALLATAVVASKEIGLVIPLAWFAVRRGAVPLRRALAETALVLALPLVLFVAMRYFIVIPHRTWDAWWQWKLGFNTQGEWGYAKPLVQVFLQNHGMLWLLWPLGVLVAPPRWRRLSLFALILIPFLAGGPWARSTGYLLPFVLPSALLVLARLSLARAAVALAASVAVALPLALRNIGITDVVGSNLLLLPGMIVFVVAVYPAVRSALTDGLGAARPRLRRQDALPRSST